MSNVEAISDKEFTDKVLMSEKPVLVDFWAEWCSPCKQLAPVIDELAGVYGDKMTFYKMDADANPLTPTEYGVMALPTLLIFEKGRVEKSFTGGKTRAVLAKAIEEHI